MLHVDLFLPKTFQELVRYICPSVEPLTNITPMNLFHMQWLTKIGISPHILIRLFVQHLYRSSEEGLKELHINKSTHSEYTLFKSKYHVELNAAATNFPTICKIIEKFGSTKNILTSSYTIICIYNMESLSAGKQNKLKIYIEGFSDSCRFIFIGTKKLRSPFISSSCIFVCFKITPLQLKLDLIKRVNEIQKTELTPELIHDIANSTENISYMLSLIQLYQISPELYATHIDSKNEQYKQILQYLLQPKLQNEIFTLMYCIVVSPKKSTNIFRTICLLCTQESGVTDDKKIAITQAISKYENWSISISNPLYCIQTCIRQIHQILHL